MVKAENANCSNVDAIIGVTQNSTPNLNTDFVHPGLLA